jgi:hypothetical protein
MSESNRKLTRDEFLSEEDLDLRNLSEQELIAVWQRWLEQAQSTNDLDVRTYSHGVFEIEPDVRASPARSRPGTDRNDRARTQRH